MAQFAIKNLELSLVERRFEAGDVYSFIFKSGEPISWQPGQYMIFELEHENPDERKTKRPFSIASAPFEGVVMISTRYAGEKASSFKKALYNLPPGGIIKVSGPIGNMVMDDPSRDYVLIAGGIGITPFRAIFMDADYAKFPSKITLLYSNSTPEFVYKSELERIAAKNDNINIRYFVSPERITEDAVKEVAPNMGNTMVFMSGPPPMVEAYEKMCDALGVSYENVRKDIFIGY